MYLGQFSFQKGWTDKGSRLKTTKLAGHYSHEICCTYVVTLRNHVLQVLLSYSTVNLRSLFFSYAYDKNENSF